MHMPKALLSALLISQLLGCGAGFSPAFSSAEGVHAGGGTRALHPLWSLQVSEPDDSSYVPVEHAVGALDPEKDRIYVGSTHGDLLAINPRGRIEYVVETDARIESEVLLDSEFDHLWFGTEQGKLFSLRASDGKVHWQKKLDAPVRRTPVLREDVLFVATERDSVIALDNKDGTVLWRYERPAPETLSIAGRAGLYLDGSQLITGFTDGALVSLSVRDGSVRWETDLAGEASFDGGEGPPRFLDVDTTPTRVGDELWVASYAAGLYAVNPETGNILWNDSEVRGVTSIAAQGELVLLSSGEHGLVCVRSDRSELWRRPTERGAPGRVAIADNIVYFGESTGSFFAVGLHTGEEFARLDLGNGFSAAPAVFGGIGVILSNGGTLVAFKSG